MDISTTVIKGYQIQELLGAGGFGDVYRATRPLIGGEVAIKIIAPQHANQPDFIRRFEAEAQIVAHLDHLHIVPLYDYWRDPNGAYLVMRWLKGGTLKDLLQQGALDLKRASQFLDQIASALTAAHRQGVIHRDIKPSNILLDEDGNVYVSDFGIAKDLNLAHDHTQQDAIIGSPGYLSPEQARNDPISPRTDVYSLGVMLHEMLTGTHPFPKSNPVELIYKHMNDPLPLIPQLNGVAPATLATVNQIIQQATEKNPAHRYADVLELANAFRKIAIPDVTPTSTASVVEHLTRREQEILQLLIEQKTNREIAEGLVVTHGTVRWYITQIYKKLNVTNRTQAILKAKHLNLVFSAPDEAHSTFIFTTIPDNPYKGLLAFQSADSHDFFGREKVTQKLLNRLQENEPYGRFLAVVGPSGSGKSSLVKAGVIPAILGGKIPGSDKWFVQEMIPSNRPLDELEIVLTRIMGQTTTNLREHLERDEFGLVRLGQMLLPDDGSQLLLVIDQFEELFTLVEDESQRQHFLNLLYAAVTDRRSRVRVIVTLRADFYDRPLQYVQFGEMLRERLETVLPLSAEELERAIAEPARRAGVQFEEGLVASIIADIHYQPGALPLLQYALTELFNQQENRKITHAHYQAIGRTTGALAKRADETYLDLTLTAQATARQLFLRLVTLGEGTEDTRRRVLRSELLALASDRDLVDEVLDAYAHYRLLAYDNDPATRTPTVEVAHEAILREWERLREWLNESREDIKLQRTLAQLTETWTANGHDTSYLVSGNRLQTFAGWAKATELALTPTEHQFLAASVTEHERQEAEKREQKQREIALSLRARRILQGLVATFIICTIGASLLAMDAMDARDSEARTRVEAQRERNNAQNAQATSAADAKFSQALYLASEADHVLSNNDPELAIALAMEAYHLAPDADAVRRTLANVASRGGSQAILPSDSSIQALVVSEDERFLVVGTQTTGTVTLWDLQTRQKIREWHLVRTEDIDYVIFSLDISKDNQWILVGGNLAGQNLWLLNITTGDMEVIGYTGVVRNVQFSANDRQFLVSIIGSGVVQLWDTASRQIVRQGLERNAEIRSLGFSEDSRTILYTSFQFDTATSQTIYQWVSRDVATFDVIQRIERRIEGINPEGYNFLTTDYQYMGYTEAQQGEVLDARTGETIRSMHLDEALSSYVHRSVLTTPAGFLILARPDGFTLYDVDSGTTVDEIVGVSKSDQAMGYLQQGLFISANSSTAEDGDNAIRFWDLNVGKVRQAFAENGVLTPDGSLMLLGLGMPSSIDAPPARLRLVDPRSGSEIRPLDIQMPGIPYEATFSGDSQTLALAFYDVSASNTTVVFYEFPSMTIISQSLSPGYIGDTNFSPNGQYFVTGETLFTHKRHDGYIFMRVWNIASGKEINRFVQSGGIFNAYFLDDQRVITGGYDSLLHIWAIDQLDQVNPRVTLEGHLGYITSLALNTNDTRLLSSDDNGKIILWDTATLQPLATYQFVNNVSINALAFSSDGQLGIIGSSNGDVWLWNLQNGERIYKFQGHGSGISHLQFSADGQLMLVSYQDYTTHIWNVPPYRTTEEMVFWLQNNRYIPTFTCEQRMLFNIQPFCKQSDEILPTHTPTISPTTSKP